MRFYCVRDRIRQNHFHIFWEEGKKYLADYVAKHHLIYHHRTMRPRYVEATQKDIKTQKTGELRLEEGVLELPILMETGNWTTPLRESGIKFHGTWIIPKRESSN